MPHLYSGQERLHVIRILVEKRYCALQVLISALLWCAMIVTPYAIRTRDYADVLPDTLWWVDPALVSGCFRTNHVAMFMIVFGIFSYSYAY